MFSRKTKDQQTKKSKIRSSLSWLTATKKRQRLSILVGILVIGLTGQIIYSSFAATTEYSQIPEVAKMQQLTEEVVAMTEEYASMPDTIANKKGAHEPNQAKEVKKQELISKIKERKDAYKLAMQYDPQVSANNYLPYNTRQKLPPEINQYLEIADEYVGYWVSGHIDGENQSRNLVRLQLEENRYLVVYGDKLPDFVTGAKVRITGIKLDHSLIAALPMDSANTKISVLPQYLSMSRLIGIDRVEAGPSICKIIVGPVLGGKVCPEDEVSMVSDPRPSNAPEVVVCINPDSGECGMRSGDTVTNDTHPMKLLVIPLKLPGEDGGLFSDGETYNVDEIEEAFRKIPTNNATKLAN